MNIVGQRFEDCEYYLSELIYAADIFKKAGAPLQEELKSSVQSSLGTLVLGTVKNDIHDFGKDIVATVFDDMKDAIGAIKDAGLRDQVTILIGGGPVDQATADYVGADVYCKTAQD